MLQAIERLNPSISEFSSEFSETSLQQFRSIQNTIISLQYNPYKLLVFKISEVRKGIFVGKGLNDKDAVLKCEIRGTTYTLTHEHLHQMSNRERSDLFNQPRMGNSQFV